MSNDVVEVCVGGIESQTSNFAETFFVKLSARFNWNHFSRSAMILRRALLRQGGLEAPRIMSSVADFIS